MLTLVGGHNVLFNVLNMPALGFIKQEQAPTNQSGVKFSYQFKRFREEFSKRTFILDSVGGGLVSLFGANLRTNT